MRLRRWFKIFVFICFFIILSVSLHAQELAFTAGPDISVSGNTVTLSFTVSASTDV
jgi:hypothetical protein